VLMREIQLFFERLVFIRPQNHFGGVNTMQSTCQLNLTQERLP